MILFVKKRQKNINNFVNIAIVSLLVIKIFNIHKTFLCHVLLFISTCIGKAVTKKQLQTKSHTRERFEVVFGADNRS